MNKINYPLVAYSGSGGKGGGQPNIEKDSLFSRDHVEAVIAFGEGVYYGLVDGLKSIRFNDERLQFNDEFALKDVYLGFRMGYEDDQPINYFLRGESTIVTSNVTKLLAEDTFSVTTQSQLRNSIRYIQIRFIVQALYRGSNKGDMYANALALLIKYRPASSTSDSDWRYVTDGTSDRVRQGLLEDTTRAYVRDQYGLDYNDLTESQQKLYAKEAESILENYDNIKELTDEEINLGDRSRAWGVYFKYPHVLEVSTRQYLMEKSLGGAISGMDLFYYLVGKTTTGYIHELTLPVPLLENDDWEIQITKKSPEYSTESKRYHGREIGIQEISAISNSTRQYPRTVLAHMVAPYDDQFSSLGDISAEFYCMLIDVPVNYNGFNHSYDESDIWLGNYKKAWSNNPVWVLREVIMNVDWGKRRYEPNLQIDNASFYYWAKYCDQLLPSVIDGVMQPRHTFNDSISDVRDLDNFMNYICSSFRGSLFERNGIYYLIVDTLTEPKFFVTSEMITDVGFTYAKTELSTRWNFVRAKFQNQDLDYDTDTRIVTNQSSIDKYGLISGEVQPVGCTNLSEILRHAAYALLTNSYETTLVSFQLPRMGLYLKQYDIFVLVDQSIGWGNSARILKYQGSKLYFQYKLNLPVNSTVFVMFHTNTGVRVVEGTITDDYMIQLIDPVDYQQFLTPDAPIAYWDSNVELNTDNAPRTFRILSVTDEGTGDATLYTFECSIIYPSKYSRVDNLSHDDPELSYSSETFELAFGRISPPTNLRLRIINYLTKGGFPMYKISFDEVAGASQYEATWYYSEGDGTRYTQTIQGTGDKLHPALPNNGAPINLELVAIAPDGRRSRPTYLIRYLPSVIIDTSRFGVNVMSYGFVPVGTGPSMSFYFQITLESFDKTFEDSTSTQLISEIYDLLRGVAFFENINGSKSSINFVPASGTALEITEESVSTRTLTFLIGGFAEATQFMSLSQNYTVAVDAQLGIIARAGFYDLWDKMFIGDFGLTPTKIVTPQITGHVFDVNYSGSPVPTDTKKVTLTLTLPDGKVNKIIHPIPAYNYSLDIVGTSGGVDTSYGYSITDAVDGSGIQKIVTVLIGGFVPIGTVLKVKHKTTLFSVSYPEYESEVATITVT